MRLRSKRLTLDYPSLYDETSATSVPCSDYSGETSHKLASPNAACTPRRSARNRSASNVAPSPATPVVRKLVNKRLKLSPCESPLHKHVIITDTVDSSSDESVSVGVAPNKNSLEAARRSLRVSFVPETLPGREGEFSNIYSFLRGKLSTQSGGCMYISGVPGTGKTATSLGVIARLQRETRGVKNIPKFIYSHLNGMQLSRPEHLYTRLANDVFGEKRRISADKCLKLLDDYFSDREQEPVVVLLDEVDLLCTRKQTLLYNLFDWTARPGTRLTVLAIANTMDLPERAFAGRVASRIGLTRTIFQPYSYRQLHTIIQARLREIPAFDSEAIELVSRKVAAVSGDARRALDICRRATEVPRDRNSDKLGIAHVDRALTEMFSSLKITAVKSASTLEQLFLRSVLSAVRESECEEVPVQSVLKNLTSLAHFQGLPTPSHTESFRCLRSLVASRLLLATGPANAELLLKINLNISIDDLTFALKSLQN